MTMYHNHMQECKRPACHCVHRDDPLEGLALGMAYVPWQNWNTTYTVEKALCRGTIFPELDKPFCGGRK